MNDKRNEFLKLFRETIFANIDEKKEQPPRHTTNLLDVLMLNEGGRWGAYFTVNGFANFAQNRSRTIDSCTSLNAHFVEVDNPSKSTQEIANEATALAAEKGIPFTCIVKTGRGIHGYWILKEPITRPTNEQREKYGYVQDQLTEIFGGDRQAKDIARVLRVPQSRYWKDKSGREIELGTITDHRYDETDFLAIVPPQSISTKRRGFTPIHNVMLAHHGERHGKSFALALKLSNRFSDEPRHIVHALYRTVIDRHFEEVAGDDFHKKDGEADKQFESAWNQIQSNPRLRQERENDEPKEFEEALSLTDLLSREFPEPQWVVDKLFESGTINMISARPNHYKSWVVLAAALASAKGEKLFGEFQTTKQSVMIVNEEDSLRMIQSRMKLIDPVINDLPIYFHVQKELKLTDSDVHRLLEEAQLKGVTMIVFDSLRSVHSGDENSSKEMQEVMDHLKKFTRKGITVLFTHHNRKKPPFGGNNKDDGEESRGSSGINAAVHGHISLVAHDENNEKFLVVRQQKLKGEEKIKPFELLISPVPWRFIYRKHEEVENNQDGVDDMVLFGLENEDVWLSVEELVSSGAGRYSSVRLALKNLVRLGKAEVKKRKEVMVLKLPTRSQKGAPNQNLYHYLPQEDPETDPQAD